VAALAFVLGAIQPIDPALSAEPQPFEGKWIVDIVCADAPDGARGYKWLFTAQVQDGALLGQYHQPGTVPSGTLSGKIQPDGDALLSMTGLTGNPNASVGQVDRGTPFHYTATAHFDGDHGTGKRNESRVCTLNFLKS
jgi:hypothetical protein